MENLGEFIVNHWILSSLFVVLLFLIFSDTLTRQLSGAKSLSVNEAVTLVNQQKGCFVDIRSKEAFEKSHIADAVNLPPDALAEAEKKLKKPQQPLVVVCDSGQRARQAARQLKKQGYTDVSVMTGGLYAWREAKLPLFD
ncbi:Rhodanese-like sulfurtransferase [Methylophaga frappieri]|uniref:Rhodanese-like sulfurtransferase n=1 Tax=Methylophaga frappieri (strain ATCC BAA-2434 / DSM 25690 / JAM7) TaxID=754477 RepID=I1YJQ6_METFJ|nr:rhodanese-like domain-containing protein [Methylophaga frappieri]AFJ03149.1 Rhodanese-like sulfurtransferase [Methylophaga frappieri]